MPIEKVEFSADGENWQEAELETSSDRYAWSKWSTVWEAKLGKYMLQCRATDANGNMQPLTSPWDESGFGNNATQKVAVTVR